MKIAIIALILATAALGLGSFATFRSFDSEDTVEATPVAAQPGWSTAKCQRANSSLGALEVGCIKGDCAPYADMILAIADNCP